MGRDHTGIVPIPKALKKPVAPVAPGAPRVDFNALPVPTGYVAGRGRGASGFVTRSDIGSARAGAVPGAAPGDAPPAADAGAESRPFDKFLGNDAGAFGGAPLDADDVEADAVWAAVDARVERKRGRAAAAGGGGASSSAAAAAPASREAQLKESVAAFTGAAIADSFADLKRGLASVAPEAWDAIPDIGDTTIKKARREFYAPAPDTLLARAVAERETATSVDVGGGAGDALTAGGSLTEVGDGRRTVVSLNLDRAADSVDGQTVVDPKGYLTSLASVKLASAAEVGDIKKARTLLRSVTATNPRHAPGWVAAARLEEVAGNLAEARAAAARGCELCPRSEDVWLEAARLARPDAAKGVLARGVTALPTSVRLWLAAAAAEEGGAARSRVLRKALERVPASVRLWKAAVDLAPADDARVLLARAVECCPQHVDLWLALARLESHANARKVLNRARVAIPTDRAVWLAAARLEEANGGAGLVPKIVERGVASLRANSVVIDRDEWLKEAEAAEKADPPYPVTCRAIVAAVVGLGVEDADRKRTWLADADEALSRGAVETARAILAAATAALPSKKSVWRKAAELEAKHGSPDAVDGLLQRAVTFCPQAEVLWLMAAKHRWLAGDVGAARAVLADAFAANPDSEAVWLAAFKLEFESGEVDRARAILAKARAHGAASTARVWLKSALVERAVGDAAAEAALLEAAIAKFPSFDKLHLMAGQAAARRGDVRAARAAYARGLAACPASTPLWVEAARLEEGAGAVGRARAVLEQARARNPGDAGAWLAAVRVEARAGNDGAAGALLARALQACPASGALWAEAIAAAPRPQRRAKSVDALKRCNDDPAVLAAVAALFAADRKVDKARSWYARAVKLAPAVGDLWAAWYAFERAQGDAASAARVAEGAVAAAPRYGERWTRVSKDPARSGATTAEVLALVADDMKNPPP